MSDTAPETIVTVATLRDEAVNMWIPFQVSAKCMKDHDKTGSEIHGFVLFVKHSGDNTGYSMEKTVKQRAIFQKEMAEIFINGKNTMAVCNVYKFKGHRGSALHGVKIAASGAKPAVTSERNKF